jgi:trans-aconitate methyltransferase
VSSRTSQIRNMIGTTIGLDREWMGRTAIGRDDPARYLPWMPFSWPDFIALVSEALPETTGDKFLDIGAGVGTKMMLAEEIFGLDVQGIERVSEYVKEARSRGLTIIEADALGWDGYGDFDIIFFNRPFFNQEMQAELEKQVWTDMKPGAVVVGVNLLVPPPAPWYLILDDSEVRRWVMQKP